MSETRIEPGDTVIIQLDANDQVSVVGEVLYMPQATGDAIILKNPTYGLYYVQQYYLMTRMSPKAQEQRS